MSRSIAVTGATGFIGAMLVDHLLAAGWALPRLIMPMRSIPWLAS